MRFCQDHWDKLKAAIRERGLFEFVANSGDDCARKMEGAKAEAEVGAEPSVENFEPLMMAHIMIVHQGVHLAGPGVLEGDNCLVCEAMKNLSNIPVGDGKVYTPQQIEDDWINGPADGVLTYAREHKFVSTQ